MGIEIRFHYEAEHKDQFTAPERVVYLSELFESPDLLLKLGTFKSRDALKEAGLWPSFAEAYRKEFRSFFSEIVNSSEKQLATRLKAWKKQVFGHLNKGGNLVDLLENSYCSVTVEPSEVRLWAESWQRILDADTLAQPELLRIFLPYGYANPTRVLGDLEIVRAQAEEALDKGVVLRFEARME
jgi:hypothetical protein